ncbi:High mobility group B protein 14 [Hibiscus syriacus]|uniref:High mobility group B protein 14 n=1 Tax=Hibiscus syriacus TaxID=106335 RepID=A0A6A2YGL2_HIBSY|nr:high mobility group B protein 14-like [Hibiscus syriacus]KAE8673334.1 High mobility group B protein 14 [Hibiscus syriacus]
MAKKASKSKNDRSSSTSVASAKSPSTTSNHQMVLRMKSSDKMKKIAQGSVVSEKETRPKSRLKSKLQQKKKTKVDAKMPKKPPTAFFYFLEDFRKEFQEQNPDIKSMRDIGKACGEKWKTMTYEEKVKYYDIATEKRAEFDRAMAEYNKRKESGEDEETEDDSDYEE